MLPLGYTGMRVDDVAERSGLSKTTMYRRWPTKSALVVDVLRAMEPDRVPMPETGDIDRDLRAIVTDLYASLGGTALGRALPGLLAEKSADPELAAAIEQLWSDRQSQVASVVRRGVLTGQLRADLDVPAVVDLLSAPAYHPCSSRARRSTGAAIAAMPTFSSPAPRRTTGGGPPLRSTR